MWHLLVCIYSVQVIHCHLWGIGPFCFHRVVSRFVQPPGSDFARRPLTWVILHHGSGIELKHIAIIPWQYSITSLVVLESLILHLREGKVSPFYSMEYILCTLQYGPFCKYKCLLLSAQSVLHLLCPLVDLF